MRRYVWLLPVVVVGLAACGNAPNDIWGSIDESFPLDFDRVDILKQNLALRVEYIKALNGGEDKVCKVTVDTANLTIQNNSDLKDEVFMKRVTVERVAAVGGPFPAITGGDIHFDTFEFKDGGRMEGNFTVIFATGRNLFGSFRGNVKIVDTN